MDKDLAFKLRNINCQSAALASAIRDAAASIAGTDMLLERFQALAAVAEEKADEGLEVAEQLVNHLERLPA